MPLYRACRHDASSPKVFIVQCRAVNQPTPKVAHLLTLVRGQASPVQVKQGKLLIRDTLPPRPWPIRLCGEFCSPIHRLSRKLHVCDLHCPRATESLERDMSVLNPKVAFGARPDRVCWKLLANNCSCQCHRPKRGSNVPPLGR